MSGVKPHLKLLALVIPHSRNPKVRHGIVVSIGPFFIIKNQVVTALGVALRGKASLKIARIYNFAWNPNEQLDNICNRVSFYMNTLNCFVYFEE